MFGAKKKKDEAFQKVKKGAGKGKLAAKIIVIAVVILVLVSESYYSIQEEEQAVVCTFCYPLDLTSPGLHF